jgi:hypothetical protein
MRDDREDRFGLTVFVLGLLVTAVVLGVSLPMANRAYNAVIESQRRQAVLKQIMAGTLVLPQRSGPIDPLDPLSPQWAQIPAIEVTMLPQAMTMPMLDKASVLKATVQAVANGNEIAWLVVWDDPHPDFNVDSGRFCDAVALEFPLAPNAPVMMGGPTAPVQLLHWKAIWQKDLDEHFQDVQDLHPDYWVDLYWFAKPRPTTRPNTVAYRVPGSFDDPRSHQFFPAFAAGNPVSNFHRDRPVEELVAAGFGGAATQRNVAASGRGVWNAGRWHVVFSRPMNTDDALDYQFHFRTSGQFTVAIWDGGHDNVGGRKHYSDWVPFTIELP